MNVTEKPKVERIIWILLFLIRNRRKKYTAQDIVDYLSADEPVTLRSVQRDLKKLADIRESAVVCTRIKNTCYYQLEPDMRHSLSVPIKKNSLLALFLLKRLQPYFAPGKHTFKEISEVLEELSSGAQDDIFLDVDQTLDSSVFTMGKRVTAHFEQELFEHILKALQQKQQLSIRYLRDHKGTVKEYVICPVKLLLSDNDLYLASFFEPFDENFYYFKLGRIKSITLLEKSFRLSKAKRGLLHRRLEKSFGILDNDEHKAVPVLLEFPPWMNLILQEKQFHRTQRISEAENGNTHCEMTVPIEDELVRWIMSWGDAVKIIKPKKLKKSVVKKAKALVKKNA